MSDKFSYYGIVSFLFAALSVIFLAIFFAVSQLNITPQLFNQWNQTSASISCLSAPAGLLFGLIGLQGSPSSKMLSTFSILLICLPFLLLFIQFIISWMPK